MPEGPEVRIVANFLQAQVKDWTLVRIAYDKKCKYNKVQNQFHLIQGKNLAIKNVTAKGKQIFWELEDGFYLNTTLGTEGKWIRPGFHQAARANKKHSNLWLELTRKGQSQTLYYHDTRHQGNVFVMTEDQYQAKLKKIGPDLLANPPSFEEYQQVVTRKRLARKQACDFLMAQQYFSGIGNYLKAEVLYAARVHPAKSLGSLTELEIRDLWSWSIKYIQESYSHGGCTIRSFYNPQKGQNGTFQLKVYGRKKDPLGNKVYQKVFKDKRNSWYVPVIQKLN